MNLIKCKKELKVNTDKIKVMVCEHVIKQMLLLIFTKPYRFGALVLLDFFILVRA